MKKVLVPKLNEVAEQKVLGEQNLAGVHAAQRSSKLKMSFGEYSIAKSVLGLHKSLNKGKQKEPGEQDHE